MPPSKVFLVPLQSWNAQHTGSLVQGLGDRVKEYEKVSAAFASSREEIAKHEDELKALKAERSLAYDDLTVQRSLVRTLKEGEQSLEAEMQNVRSERLRIKDLAVGPYCFKLLAGWLGS